jgi:beta-galactosidase
MKTISLSIFVFSLFTLCSCSGPESDRETNFNSGWKFIRANVSGAEKPEFDDEAWRTIELPHDYSIEDLPFKEGVKQIGPFSEESEGGPSTGHVKGGTAWYRKHFKLENGDKGKMVQILFDGVYMNADVWLNGHHLGNHPYGYTAFYYDLTPHLNPPGKNNVLAVQVKNEGKNSRWYSGSGIYRDVILVVSEPVHLGVWGAFITTPVVSKEKAVVNIEAIIINSKDRNEDLELITELKNPAGAVIVTNRQKLDIKASETLKTTVELEIDNPELWSPGTPYLYTASFTLSDNKRALNKTDEKFGIRSVEFSAGKGFLLNGQNIELKGGCLHHDNGPLGSAAFRSAEYRRVKIMKENGFNAIRTAHNPPSKWFLDACDELGMLVINESFDQWKKPKNPQDYHRFFDEWWEKDIEAMVLRDRNHPSVIIWSVGNEIQERADSAGLAFYRMLSDKVKSLDPTRPVTQAVCGFWDNPGKTWEDSAPVFAQLNVHGYNYQWQQYEKDHAQYPERIIMGTESVPKEAFENWQFVEKHPYIIGDFVWTGMDYLGESGIGHTKYDNDTIKFLPPWPWFNANCGDISITGNKKSQMFFRDVLWQNSRLEMLVHAPLPQGRKEIVSFWGWPNEWKCWNGNEGEKRTVSVFTKCNQVRLELNGKVIGAKDVSENTNLTAKFEVPFQPGELTAIGITNGKEELRQVLKTTGKPHKISIIAEPSPIQGVAPDLVWFNVEVHDENGLLVPDAEILVEFKITKGKLQAVANDNPADMHSFQDPVVKSYRGKCQVIGRIEKPGEIEVLAKSNGLIAGTAKVIITASEK